MSVTERQVFDVIKKLEKKYEEVKAEEDENEDMSEKWKPKNTNIMQDHKEKVYTEYIDTEKAKALKKGQFSRFNTVERDFLKKYKDVALEPNINDKEGDTYDIYKTNQDYITQLNAQRRFIKNRRKADEVSDKVKKLEKMESTSNDFTKGVYDQTFSKTREDMKSYLKKNKTSTIEENEDFLYRHQYSKRNLAAKKSLENEETTLLKTYRDNAVDELAFEGDLRDNINSFKYTDRQTRKEFRQNLDKGAVVRGILERQKQLKDNHYTKDLSEIAYGDDQAKTNLYRKYMSYKKPQKEEINEDAIQDREDKFLEAVQKNYIETSAKANRSFQEYEDFKRNIQSQEDIYDHVDNSVSATEEDLSTRDWYSKIWSGKITNDEFGDYMFEKKLKKDVQGITENYYTQKNNPGFGDRDYITQEDKNRFNAEFIEVKRRQMVLNGQVSEEKSHEYIKHQMEESNKMFKDYNNPAFDNVKDQLLEILKAITGGEQVREYYFDDKQGVTLKEHIASVKKVSPNAHIETYVDHDGFTVVKKRIEKQYKYNLNTLLNYPVSEVEDKYHTGLKRMIDENDISIQSKFRWIITILNH